MAKLSEEFINQLKEANPIVDVFNSYAELKKRGRIYVCCCPFHVEKTPSCTIYPDTHSFYCFGCGESGDVITLLMKMDDLSYMNAVRTLANRAGMTLPIQNKQEHKFQISYDKCYEINRETANFYYNKLLRGTDKSGLQFLAAHRIRPQTVKKFGIGFASDDPQQLLHYLRSKNYSENELLLTGVCRRNPDGSLSDYFQNQILFPVIDLRGNITGFTGKIIPGEESHWSVTPENAVFSRKKLLFSLNIARYAIAETASKTIILAQDALNAAAIWQAGCENVVASWAFMTPQLVKLIAQYASEVILTYPVEQNALNDFSDADLSVRLLHLEYAQTPENYLRQHTPEEFRNLITHAGDANLIQLENCQNDLDPKDQENQSVILQRSMQILAGIRNPLEREVYLVNTAKNLQVSPDYLRIQMDLYTKRQTISQKSGVSTRSLRKEELLSSDIRNQRKFRAEQQIILFLLRFPEELPRIRQCLSPDDFVTKMHQNIYQTICENQTAFFTAEEKKCITEIQNHYQEIVLNQETLTDCMTVLRNTGTTR